MGLAEFLKQLTDPQSIIHYGGLGLLLFVIFAETGLLIGFFLPGDSLVFIAGMICVSRPEVLGLGPIPLIMALSTAAILGNMVAYCFGKRVGPALYNRKDSWIFKQRYLEITRDFYAKNGGKTIILGRFLPIIRTFAPILAGIIQIDFSRFMVYNVLGALLWIGSLCGAGYFLGNIPWVREHIGGIVISLIIITLIPLVITYWKRKKQVNH